MKSADLSAIDFYMDLFDIDFHIFTVIRPDVSERGLPRGINLNNIVRSIKLHISLLKYD